MGKEGQRGCRPSRHFLEETQEHQELCRYLNLGTSEYVARVFPIVVMWQHMFSMPVMPTVWRRELPDDGSCVNRNMSKF